MRGISRRKLESDTADMTEPFDLSDDSVVWIADTGLFIACGRQQNNKYTALERFARRNELTFVIPQRVYDELAGAPDRSTPGQTPINSAIDAGWVMACLLFLGVSAIGGGGQLRTTLLYALEAAFTSIERTLLFWSMWPFDFCYSSTYTEYG